MLVYFLMRVRKGVDMYGRGGGKNIREVRREETIIRIDWVKKLFSLKKSRIVTIYIPQFQKKWKTQSGEMIRSKRSDCPSRGLGFDLEHTHGNSKLSVTPVSGV